MAPDRQAPAEIDLQLFTTDPVSARGAVLAGITAFVLDWEWRGDLRVDTYEDGSGVVTLCALTLPDLVILDVDMPGLDGIETFYCIKEISRVAATRVVFQTGYAGSEEVRARIDRAIGDGACRCLPKPASAADIKSLLDARVFAV